MPEISRFLGIVIAMFYNDHAPPLFMRSTANWKSAWISNPDKFCLGHFLGEPNHWFWNGSGCTGQN